MTASQLELPHVGALKLAPMVFIPELAGWLTAGREPDNDMLTAILRNDLAAVVALSPGATFDLPRATLRWLWNYAPPRSFGSPALFEQWRASFDKRETRRKDA